MRAEIPTAHLSKLVRAIRQANFWYLRYRPGRCDARGKVWLASDDPAVLDHALHADNTRVDRGNPGYRCPLNRLPVSRLLLPRSGLERSDFVPWHFSDMQRLMMNVGFRG